MSKEEQAFIELLGAHSSREYSEALRNAGEARKALRTSVRTIVESRALEDAYKAFNERVGELRAANERSLDVELQQLFGHQLVSAVTTAPALIELTTQSIQCQSGEVKKDLGRYVVSLSLRPEETLWLLQWISLDDPSRTPSAPQLVNTVHPYCQPEESLEELFIKGEYAAMLTWAIELLIEDCDCWVIRERIQSW